MSSVGGSTGGGGSRTSSRPEGSSRTSPSSRTEGVQRTAEKNSQAPAARNAVSPSAQRTFARDSFTAGAAKPSVNLDASQARQASAARQEPAEAEVPELAATRTPTVTPEDVEAARAELPDAGLSRPPPGVEQPQEVREQNTQLQEALNELGYVTGRHVTGTFAGITEGAIKSFQYERDLEVTGTFDSATRDAMAEALAEKRAAEAQGITPEDVELPEEYTPITGEQLAAIMPGATEEQRARYLEPLNAAMEEFGITTPERQAAFLAQISEETGDLQYMEEIKKNPDHGDYFGRGLMQLTHEDNYREAGEALGVDLAGNPDAVATDPELAARTAAWYFSDRGLNELADQERIGRITLLVNGGYTGIDGRLEAYGIAMEELRPEAAE
jgi:predicted chitinase